MKLTGLDIFDATIQKTNIWLKEFMQEMNWSDRKRAYVALRYVLQAVRDSLNAEQAVYLGDQLPMLMRGVYYEHWDNPNKPKDWQTKEEFFSALHADFTANGENPANTERIVRAVFRMLERKAVEGEIADLHDILPQALQEFWPPSLRAA